jgi:hypothetical protein
MRQLLVGNDVAVAYTNGVLAAGAVDIQKEDPAGSTSLLVTDTYTTAKKIRFVQGTAEGKNIFSPWIDGKDIVVWKGETFTGQTAQVSNIAISAVNFIAAAEATVKLIELNNGQAQFKRKSYVIPVSAGTTPTQFCTALAAAINADLPDFIASITNNGTDIDFNGTTFSLSLGTELSNFKIADEGLDGSNGPVATVTTSPAPSLGYGDPEVLGQYEKSLQGDRSFYNRVELPNTPPSYIVGSVQYDSYSLVADNGALGQIKGVDNVRSITVVINDAAATTAQADFEAAFNPWLASVPGAFAAVTL